MESRLRIAGHPVHPVLVMFPLGLFSTAVIFDTANLLGGPALLGEVAYWNIAAGLVGGVLVAAAGLVDLASLPDGTRAKQLAVAHGLGNLGVLLLFAVIWMIRIGSDSRAAGGGLFAVELLALAGAGVAAWYGGELVNRFGAGGPAPIRRTERPVRPVRHHTEPSQQPTVRLRRPVTPTSHPAGPLRRPANRIGQLGGVR